MPAVTYGVYAGALANVNRLNRITNPSFEVNTTGWLLNSGTIARDTTVARFGTASMRVTGNNAANNGFYSSPRYTLSGGQTYAFSGFFRVPATSASISARILVQWFNVATGGTPIAQTNTTQTVPNTGVWTKVGFTATAPVSATHVQIYYINAAVTPTGQTWNVDACLFEQRSTVDPYFDGTNAETWTDHTLLSQSWNGTADASSSSATWRDDVPPEITQITSFDVTKGRTQVQDPFKASTCVINGRNMDQTYALFVGDPLIIRTLTINGVPIVYDVFNGFIADIKLDYGIVSNMDTWTISGEDSLALAGRTVTSQSWAAGDSCYTAATKAAIGSSVAVGNGGFDSASKVSAQVLSNERLLDVLNKLAMTEQGRLWGTGNQVIFQSRSSQNVFGLECDFTDGTLTATNPSKYDTVTFKSRADSYYTQVIIEPTGLAAQTAGTGTRTFIAETYDQTTVQADNLADYVLATLQVSQSAPASITYSAEMQTSYQPMLVAIFGNSGAYTIGIILRGVRYDCFIEGSTISATPEQTRCVLNLSSSDAAVSFILDDTILGVLDSSKLGF